MYYNRRAEVWGLMREWQEVGASIPDDPELAADLQNAYDENMTWKLLVIRLGRIRKY